VPVELKVLNWRVEVDPDATRRTHDTIRAGGPETCGCISCRNFIAVRGLAYPPAALELFDRLGIRPDRESEVCGPTRLSDGRYRYHGWFHFIGSILDRPPVTREIRSINTPDGVREIPWTTVEYEDLGSSFIIYLDDEEVDVVPPEFADEPLVQLNFFTEVPWMLPEPPKE
jgi:hypothetical protein